MRQIDTCIIIIIIHILILSYFYERNIFITIYLWMSLILNYDEASAIYVIYMDVVKF